MIHSFTEKAWDDYIFWLENDKKMLRKINNLIKDIKRNPFEGLGKPEKLKHELKGYWSRRIDHEHRLVYKVLENDIIIASCRFHY
ncbi:MAG: Txe/YoeB family addiction module toxin, partial [Bacteroidales bacterium]|nr:Txe/YoeB family addiction module toxin [Bacteroidales bacterium]